MYFDNFPVIVYDSVGQGKYKDVTNLLRRVAMRSKVKSNTLMFDTYDVKEGETPEMIADKLYDDPELHWVVLMVNDITDRYHDWPMDSGQFQDYLNDKYSDINATHHYEIAQSSGDTSVKIWIENDIDTSAYSGATIVTNYEYELEEQDRKRKIRLLDPRFIDQFLQEFQTKMRESII